MSQYNFSFTTGSLYLNESVEILELYLRIQDWEAVKNSCYSENTIQAKTKSSLLTVTREVISRVKLLTPSEINFFQQATFQEQKYLLWIAICRKYSFIHEFATSILRERYISLQLTLTFEISTYSSMVSATGILNWMSLQTVPKAKSVKLSLE